MWAQYAAIDSDGEGDWLACMPLAYKGIWLPGLEDIRIRQIGESMLSEGEDWADTLEERPGRDKTFR